MIQLDKDQQAKYDNIIRTCCDIEKDMSVTIDAGNAQAVEDQLANVTPWLANLSVIISDATEIYDWAKGRAADEAIGNDLLLNAKAEVQRRWFDGKLAKYNALYVRAENLSKNLRSQIDGLRSILSFEKEQLNVQRTT